MRTAGIVLAAGTSSRLGRPKQLLPYRGGTLLQYVLGQVNAARLDEVVVVLGASAEAIRRKVDIGRARLVVNPDFAEGMSTSLRAGLVALGPEVARAAVLLGDQPSVSTEMIDRILRLHEASGLPAASYRFGGVMQPPVVVARELWPQVMAASGDEGCRKLIRLRWELVAAIDADHDWSRPVDVDTEEDYRRLLEAGPSPV